jgi:uncharacterized membrane protein
VSTLESAQLANLIIAGLLAGNDAGHWGVVHPALSKISVAASYAAERSIFYGYRRVMPILVPLTLASGIVVAILTQGHSASFWLAVAGCIAVLGWQIVAVSLYPVNRVILEERDEPPADNEWWGLRRRWYQRHTIRVALVAAALVCFILSALLA